MKERAIKRNDTIWDLPIVWNTKEPVTSAGLRGRLSSPDAVVQPLIELVPPYVSSGDISSSLDGGVQEHLLCCQIIRIRIDNNDAGKKSTCTIRQLSTNSGIRLSSMLESGKPVYVMPTWKDGFVHKWYCVYQQEVDHDDYSNCMFVRLSMDEKYIKPVTDTQYLTHNRRVNLGNKNARGRRYVNNFIEHADKVLLDNKDLMIINEKGSGGLLWTSGNSFTDDKLSLIIGKLATMGITRDVKIMNIKHNERLNLKKIAFSIGYIPG